MKGNSTLGLTQCRRVGSGAVLEPLSSSNKDEIHGARCVTMKQEEKNSIGFAIFKTPFSSEEDTTVCNQMTPKFGYADVDMFDARNEEQCNVVELKQVKRYSSKASDYANSTKLHVPSMLNLQALPRRDLDDAFSMDDAKTSASISDTASPFGTECDKMNWNKKKNGESLVVPTAFSTFKRSKCDHFPGYAPSSTLQFADEPFFTGYNGSFASDEVYDISETNFDFTTVTGYGMDDDYTDNYVSIIDMVCGVADETEERAIGMRRDVLVEAPKELESAAGDPPLYKQMQVKLSMAKKGKSNKKSRGSKASKEPIVVDPVNVTKESSEASGEVAKGPASEERIEWYPGFNRQLGAKGRSALLELVRRVYRQNPPYYKSILQARNPPSSISNLPFFNIPMLWELTHQFGVFQQAVAIHKSQMSAALRNDKSRGRSRVDRSHAALAAQEAKAQQLSQEVAKDDQTKLSSQSSETSWDSDTTGVSQELQSSMQVDVPNGSQNKLAKLNEEPQEQNTTVPQNLMVKRDATMYEQMSSVEATGGRATPPAHVEHVKHSRYQGVRGDNAGQVEPVKQHFTTLSGRSIKPTKRYADYQGEYGNQAKRYSAYNESHNQTTNDTVSSCDSNCTSRDPSNVIAECDSPALSSSTVVSLSKSEDGSGELDIESAELPPLSLVWCVKQQISQKNMDARCDAMAERLSPVASARGTPSRCISV